MPGKVGISRRTLFAGRKSDELVTNKTWLLLDRAEHNAGINAAAGNVMREASKLAEAVGGTEDEKQARFERLIDPHTELVSEIVRLRARVGYLEGIIENVKGALFPDASGDPGKSAILSAKPGSRKKKPQKSQPK